MKTGNHASGIPHGIIVIDKPPGPTSHEVAAWVRDILGVRTGQAGTLDPAVSGILIVMLGKAAKIAEHLLAHEKEYICLLKLHGNAPEDEIRRVVSSFCGRIYQRPPRRSAVKRALRIRTIHEIQILDIKERLVLFRVRCEAGTYIRTLCVHIGLALGVRGQMIELRRTESGGFTTALAHTLHELADAKAAADDGDPEALEKMILPVERAVADLPSITLRDTAVDAVCRGAQLAGVGIVSCGTFQKGDTVTFLTVSGECIGLGTARVSSEKCVPGRHGLVARPKAILMEPGTYPRGWREKSRIK
ncbi:MAG: RNA-guided pseudouridylation complex pseudouridine synthase subunit Cbf5 [Methanocalculus sp. MSAO_Arc1]|uniref:RNA-guided pseudouridylation complex pseudouridine synthase subunit Cbf5 n=1 Tax=Methanocalculus TaxID=71151 RepID=UPI000FEFFB9B|nr:MULTISPECIES: RNA-guided pseudouridylation complex pseudouridine synthase subunit Cbf5 [unclassified Methanocalculus]MCP1662953.1 putative rRNA pseudouridine synthase [Methanocalculus sp. AMF5]RQD81475.1 MAG: RNA-guided pseudouridylation complex pseudouridine synthase subunit Cbf5 [Methanocalculus sp. MSAO_Arc1]